MPTETTKRTRSGSLKTTDTHSKRTLPPSVTEDDDLEFMLDEDDAAALHENDDDDADDDYEDGDDETHEGSGPSAGEILNCRKKNPCVILSDANEKLVATWLENEAEFVYNKGLSSYKDKTKVWDAFEEKGRSLVPPVSGNELRTWFTSLRSRFGRLTAEKSSKGPGSRRRLTDREKWILSIFHFLEPHIVRHKSKRSDPATSFSHAQATSRPPSVKPSAASPISSSDEQASAADEPRPKKSRKSNGCDGGITALLDAMIQKKAGSVSEETKTVANPEEEEDRKITYWRRALEDLAQDCGGVAAHLRVPLKMELLATIHRFVKASQEGVTRPPRSMLPHTTAEVLWEGHTSVGAGGTPSASGSQSIQHLRAQQQLALLQAQLAGTGVTTPKDLAGLSIGTSFLENFN
ncbi:uncharacterized protein LOC135198675 [Macrobrachium nipponense]|uniref:uncharacterized protein LOC135198675 n=1 Tax=Macrobrachium nipponense TaxID=159736 RepID=UPI0030C88152